VSTAGQFFADRADAGRGLAIVELLRVRGFKWRLCGVGAVPLDSVGLGMAVDVWNVFWRRPAGLGVEGQRDCGASAVGVDRAAFCERIHELEAEAESCVAGAVGDPDTGIDDGDGDLAGVVFDDEPDVAGGSWVRVADGVSDCFGDSERDRREQLAVTYPGSGKGIDGGVPCSGHRCCGRGPSPAENPGHYLRRITLQLGLLSRGAVIEAHRPRATPSRCVRSARRHGHVHVAVSDSGARGGSSARRRATVVSRAA